MGIRRMPALLLALACTAQAQVYKWADADGRIHYSDSAPASGRQKALDIPKSYPGHAVVVPYGRQAQGRSASDQRTTVTIYTTPTCGYCKQAKAYLKERGIPFTERDVTASDSARNEFGRLGGRGVPVILVGQQRMDGYREDSLAGMLRQAGY